MQGGKSMLYTDQCRLALVQLHVRDGQFFAALGATRSQYFAAIGRSHALAKSMFVSAFSIGRLESSFHLFKYKSGFRSPKSDCKDSCFSEMGK